PAMKPGTRSLHDLDFSLQGAGGLDGLNDGDDVAGLHAKTVEACYEILQGYAGFKHCELYVAAFIDIQIRTRDDHGFAALSKGVCLRDLRRLCNFDRQVALRDGNIADTHIRPHDDHA